MGQVLVSALHKSLGAGGSRVGGDRRHVVRPQWSYFLQQRAYGGSKTFTQDVSTLLRKCSPSDLAMILSRIILSAGSACPRYRKPA